MKKRLFTLVFGLLLSATLPALAFAKTVNLYDQPAVNAKVVSTIDIQAGFVPIYSPQNSEWMKVGDPKNGNVGWVKTSDLNAGNPSSVTVTQKIVNDGTGPKPVQSVQYGATPPPSPLDTLTPALNKNIEQQQVNIQKAMDQLMKDINTMYKNQVQIYNENAGKK